MKEIWKDINGYEGLYRISNLGRVKSLEKEWISGNGIKKWHPDIILNPGKGNNGYKVVLLYKNGRKTKTIHRLVAEAFIKNEYTKSQINHIDGNKNNNK